MGRLLVARAGSACELGVVEAWCAVRAGARCVLLARAWVVPVEGVGDAGRSSGGESIGTAVERPFPSVACIVRASALRLVCVC